MNRMNFYNQLPPLRVPLTGLFAEDRFHPVPPDWHVAIADVVSSTTAVAAGRHNDVNLLAAGSLIAALNVAKKYKTEIPFFFGGDGSTLLVPEPMLKEVLGSLAAHNANAVRNFGLQLHTGSLPVARVVNDGHAIRVAKLYVDASFTKAIAVGDGLRYAEEKIKAREAENAIPAADEELNVTGLECRWNKIKPPLDEDENVCYLIEATHHEAQLPVFGDVLQKMEEVFGDTQTRNPLSLERLRFMISLRKVRREMMAKFGRWRAGYYLSTFFRTLFGKFYLSYNWRIGGQSGHEYLRQLIAHADTLTVDGRINTIICGKPGQHERLLSYLSQKKPKACCFSATTAARKA